MFSIAFITKFCVRRSLYSLLHEKKKIKYSVYDDYVQSICVKKETKEFYVTTRYNTCSNYSYIYIDYF